MLVIGLTGGIASGKSTVSTLLKARNIPVIDADILAREVVLPGTPCLAEIAKYFGPEVLLPDGSLDRKKLGSIIFNDDAKRIRLNSIIHPAVRWAMAKKVFSCWIKGEKLCILDVPLLIEGALWKWMGKVVVVYCSSELQLQRLIQRDQSSRESALSRLKSQLPIMEKVEYADEVLDNSGSLHDLDNQVDSFVQRLNKEVGWSWRLSWLLPPLAILSAAWVLTWKVIRRTRRQRLRKRKRRNNTYTRQY